MNVPGPPVHFPFWKATSCVVIESCTQFQRALWRMGKAVWRAEARKVFQAGGLAWKTDQKRRGDFCISDNQLWTDTLKESQIFISKVWGWECWGRPTIAIKPQRTKLNVISYHLLFLFILLFIHPFRAHFFLNIGSHLQTWQLARCGNN